MLLQNRRINREQTPPSKISDMPPKADMLILKINTVSTRIKTHTTHDGMVTFHFSIQSAALVISLPLIIIIPLLPV